MKLVECVPNFSEGRRREVIEAIANEVRTRNVRLLDVESDANHNRSVLTFVGAPEAVKDAAMGLSARAIELIDLNHHRGEHPRMGAVDVVPFIPIADVTMEECVQLAKEFGQEYASRFQVPVYLYEAAATRPDRQNLADVRKGEFEELRKQIGRDPVKKPDFGPEAIHPTAGATAVGARQILIAYNINLATDKLDVAKRIAKQVRGKDGGLSAVKALGFELKDRGLVQVSMNMVDYKASELYKVFELVVALAQREGVEVAESEVVGLVPSEALTDSAKFYLRLHGFKDDHILERKLSGFDSNRLVDRTLTDFSVEVASDKPVPGGGSVSAYIACLAASLVGMVARLSRKKAEPKNQTVIDTVLRKSDDLRTSLLDQVDRDAEGFTELMKAYRLPKETETDRMKRSETIQAQLKMASEVPLTTAKLAVQTISEAKELAAYANLNAISDLETATAAAFAGFSGAVSNVRINLSSMSDSDYRKGAEHKIADLEKQAVQDQKEFQSRVAMRKKP